MDQLKIYDYQIITDPYRPDIKIKEIKKLIESDDFRVLDKKIEIADNGIVKEYYSVVVPEEIIGVDFDGRLRLEELISEANYPHLSYSFDEIGEIDEEIAYQISLTVKSLLNKKYYLDIDNVQILRLNDNIIFVPTDEKGDMIYISSANKYPIKYSDIEGYNLISDDPLVPYASRTFDKNFTNYKSTHGAFFVKSDEDQLRNVTTDLREQGYFSIPSSYNQMNKKQIIRGGEYSSEYGSQLKRVDPYIVGKFSQQTLKDLNFDIDNWIVSNMDSDIPFYNMAMPSFWNIYVRKQDPKNIHVKIELLYATLKSYIEICNKYPILNTELDSIKIINDHEIHARFCDINQIKDFKKQMIHTLKYIINSHSIDYIPFSLLDNAIAYKWKLSNVPSLIICSDQLNEPNRRQLLYYVVIDQPKGSTLPDKNNIKFIYKECMNEWTLYHQQFKITNQSNTQNKIISKASQKSLVTLLKYYPVNNNLYSITSFEELLDGVYKSPEENIVYPYSLGIKLNQQMLYGYFDSPTGFMKGMMNKYPGLADMNVEIGNLLMSKHKITEELALYSFEITIHSTDFLLPTLNSGIEDGTTDLRTERPKKRVELSLLSGFRPDLNKISTNYLPSDDPGYMIRIFDMMLPIGQYTDKDIYEYIKLFWAKGWVLSKWAKYVYLKHGKLSAVDFNIPSYLVESSENVIKSKYAIKKLNSLILKS